MLQKKTSLIRKKKSRAIQENDLFNAERTRAKTITNLCEKYKCELHKTPCFVQENRHLQLNPARLQLWAREIVSILFIQIKADSTFYFFNYK